MAFALAADRTRTIGRTVVAVLRRHPVLLLPMVVLVSGVIVVTMLSLVTISTTPLRFPATDPTPHGAAGQPANGAGPAGGGPAASPKQTSPQQPSPQQPNPQQPSPQQTSPQQPSAPPTSPSPTRPRQNSQQQNSRPNARDSTTPTPVSTPTSVLPAGVWYLSAQASAAEALSAGGTPAAKTGRSLCVAVGPTSICLPL
jgi:hypothetical protein